MSAAVNHMDHADGDIVELLNADAASSIVFVCEHASAHIPASLNNLGLPETALGSHVAWDPGALALAKGLARRFDALLVAAKTSRLVYDCNRPPDAPDAMPARSEVVDIPGNATLTGAEKAARVARYYAPFRRALADVLTRREAPVLVTVHSFTPVYHGASRDVEIGILHDDDARLADAMLAAAQGSGRHVVRRNEPYGPKDGVTHTLKEHAVPAGHLNVMLEVRNDLIADAHAQRAMTDTLAGWLDRALAATQARV